MHRSTYRTILIVTLAAAATPAAAGQQPKSAPASESAVARTTTAAPALPPGYVIGTEDVLSIVFWRDKDMSADVVVRPAL